MPVESSIMTSLDELRAIHSQRISDERATFEAERMAVVERRRTIELAEAAAVQAKLREERDAQVRIAEARATAEREARMKLEATELAERTRYAAELDARRQAQELELRREEVSRKRPRWMIAVTALAVAAGISLGYVAVQSSRDADEATERQVVAERQKAQAKLDAKAAEDQLAMIEKDLDTVHAKVEQAVGALEIADEKVGVMRAKQAVEAAQAEEAAQRRRLEQWKHDQFVKERKTGLHQENCVNTPTGCMPH